MKINSNTPLPHLCKPFFSGELSDSVPYEFRFGNYGQNLVKSEWEELKKFAVPSEETKEETEDVKESAPEQPADEDDEADKEALEALKAQYSQMKSKNSKKGAELRSKIKELENK